MNGVEKLAEAVGLEKDWVDAAGRAQCVTDSDLRRVLGGLGYLAESDAQITSSFEKRRAEEIACRFVSIDLGQDLLLPVEGTPAAMAELTLEDGRTLPLKTEARGARQRIATSDVGETGYHVLRLGSEEFKLAIAPPRCFGIGDAASGRRPWGPAVQVPSLRDESDSDFGDFGSLREAAGAFAAAGAHAVAISPTHALFPADASRFSPYAPSSRLFLNVLFADPRLVGTPVTSRGAAELIDWEHAIPARLTALRQAFAARGDQVREAVDAYRTKAGSKLQHHAVFDALHSRFFADGAKGWQDWPQAFHDPAGETVARFADEHQDEVAFFVFAQWLAEISLEAAQQAATRGGMAVGLIADLAVGMDGGGSHAWSCPGELLSGLSIGAPPDPLGPEGQDWGLTAFSPAALRQTGFSGYIDTLRAAFRHAGGIRIDHILGLRRLWVIPRVASSAEGAYLAYPVDDMLRILAIESQRARAVVIGEDLGTVPEDLRPRLEQRGVLGMDVLWFKRDEHGEFEPPRTWRRSAAAMTGTHDLPTVAGWWRERDLDWAARLGRIPNAAHEAKDRARRAVERRCLWQAFTASGAATGRCPGSADTDPVVDAAAAHVASSVGELAIIPLEDLAGVEEQPNIPGTTDEHPNWRRRMRKTTSDLLNDERVRRRLGLIARRE
jgi:4-alpha-glucanotransferase